MGNEVEQMPNANMVVLEQENSVGDPPGLYHPKSTPPPPWTKEHKFPSKPCRLFVTRLESMPVQNFWLQNSPAW